ncbi:MAG: VWA domain-containing protein [Acidobacteria bacterium]|nr:VWA domain-containing protein [Acidobacteriota bacterium]
MEKSRWYYPSLAGITLTLILFGILLSANAQQPSNPKAKQQDEKTKPVDGIQNEQEKLEIGKTVNVRLPITVSDSKSRRLIVDLRESDFQIMEDKVPQSILKFEKQSDLPLDVAVIMDTSNSVKPKLKFEKDASVSFLYTMLTSRKDRALFATFDSQVELHQDYTNRVDLLTKAIDKVKAQGETRMYDAIYRVCEEKMGPPGDRRRAMVIITDGEDTASERTLDEAIDIAQRTDTIIYAISTKSAGFFGVQGGMVDRREDKDIKRLAEETGGRAFFTSEVIELERSFSQIAHELRNQYIVIYEPSNNTYDSKFRKIEVKLPGKKDMRIRAKDGYKAIPYRSSITNN